MSGYAEKRLTSTVASHEKLGGSSVPPPVQARSGLNFKKKFAFFKNILHFFKSFCKFFLRKIRQGTSVI
jgi:hypothetical protein